MSVVENFQRELNEFTISLKNWEILDQGVTVLWGPSGAGKSTVINGLLGFDPKAKVKWVFKGQDLSQIAIDKRQLGVVFQTPALFPHMTARDNVLFPIDKKKHSHWQQDFDFLVSALEIESILSSPSRQLSGGERQRVAMARALIYRPRMLLLDEPFSSLDETARKRVRLMLKTLCEELKCPVLLVTHDRDDVLSLATKVTCIERGKIVKEGSLESLSF